MSAETVLNHIADLEDAALELHTSLVAIPAIGPANGGDGEKEKADFLTEYLKRHGFENLKFFSVPDDRVTCGYRPNIAAIIPGKDTSKTLWIISHMDVVPEGDRSLWHTDPFKLERKKDKIFGRGVEDNHQGMVSSIIAGRAFLETETVPDVNLGILIVSDEETGSKYGLANIAAEHADIFSKDDLILIPDFGTENSKLIEVAEKSSLWLKVTVEGKQCHASNPEEGINSLIAASAMIVEIPELQYYFDDEDDLFSPPYSTFVPTKKEANVSSVNILPGKDIFYVDCRILPNYKLNQVIDRVMSMGDYVGEEYGVTVTVEVESKTQAPAPTPTDAEIITKLKKAIKVVYDVDAVPGGIGGNTVAAFLRDKGFNCAVWATILNQAHQPNETGSISCTLDDARVMSLLALND
jgi:succinyl-diaminopimelate desuccinylase